jgi:hypothetical protein
VLEEPRAELDVDAVRGVGEDVSPQNAKHGLEHRDGHQPDDEDVEGADAAMHQDLVDHDLEEQRGDEAEQLQHERRQENLGQARAVLVDGRHEPSDIEAARQVGEGAAFGHENDAAAPDRFQLLALHQPRTSLQRLLDQRLVVADLAQQQKAAVL